MHFIVLHDDGTCRIERQKREDVAGMLLCVEYDVKSTPLCITPTSRPFCGEYGSIHNVGAGSFTPNPNVAVNKHMVLSSIETSCQRYAQLSTSHSSKIPCSCSPSPNHDFMLPHLDCFSPGNLMLSISLGVTLCHSFSGIQPIYARSPKPPIQ